MKKSVLKIIFIIVAMSVLCCSWILIAKNCGKIRDVIEYNGKTYELLEYNMDIFNYNYNCNEYFEEDCIHPVSNKSWDAVYFNGDIFIAEKQVGKAIKHYASDKNYNWFVSFEKDDSEKRVPLSVTEEELEYLYNMENIQKTKTTTFDGIKQFASIVKESKDGFVFGLITLAHCEDSWFWKTEIMNDNDEEYIVPIPETLSKKLFDLTE